MLGAEPTVQDHGMALAFSPDTARSLRLECDFRVREPLRCSHICTVSLAPVSREGRVAGAAAAVRACGKGITADLRSASYYDKMCSRSHTRTYTLRTEENDPDLLQRPADLVLPKQGQDRIHQLQVLLAGSDDECIRIRGEVFDDE